MRSSPAMKMTDAMEQAKLKAENEDTPLKTDEQTSSELDDDLLEGVSGGLVQLVNPSSSRL